MGNLSYLLRDTPFRPASELLPVRAAGAEREARPLRVNVWELCGGGLEWDSKKEGPAPRQLGGDWP